MEGCARARIREHGRTQACRVIVVPRGAARGNRFCRRYSWGVFNVLFGGGATVGAALLEAPEVRAVSFTGSGAVGARVAATAASRNIRYQTEMGGKNVVIVMPDADIAKAASLTAAGAMRYAGQKCTATSRVVVARSVENEFLRQLRSQVESLPIG